MSWPSSPEWLRELQARFGELLRTPLDRSTGALTADTSAYDSKLLAAALPSATLSSAERLAIYHRQYWFRLFTVLQGLYPLTARLVGYFRFNELAADHLSRCPPRGFDIHAIGDDFAESLTRKLAGAVSVSTQAQGQLESAAVIEAAQVDEGFHRVTHAERIEPLRPGPADAARFGDSCLCLSGSVALLKESWPLSELRLGFVKEQNDEPIRLGEPWPAPRYWLLARKASKLGLLELEPREAELLQLLQQFPLEQALGRLEAAATEAERARLPGRAQAWLARSVRLGIWSGFVEAQK